MMISITKAISTSAIALGLMAIACAASADPQSRHSLDPSVKVRIADLNTSSAEGSLILYDRIADAALAVCSRAADWYPTVRSSQKDCYRATLDHAIAQLHLPALTALHAARTHRSMQASNQ
jgi:UrcA family protein